MPGVHVVRDAAEYLAYVKVLIVMKPDVAHWIVVREEAEGDVGLFRYQLELTDAASWQRMDEVGWVRCGITRASGTLESADILPTL